MKRINFLRLMTIFLILMVPLTTLEAASINQDEDGIGFRTSRSISNIARLILGGNDIPPDHPLVVYPKKSSEPEPGSATTQQPAVNNVNNSPLVPSTQTTTSQFQSTPYYPNPSVSPYSYSNVVPQYQTQVSTGNNNLVGNWQTSSGNYQQQQQYPPSNQYLFNTPVQTYQTQLAPVSNQNYIQPQPQLAPVSNQNYIQPQPNPTFFPSSQIQTQEQSQTTFIPSIQTLNYIQPVQTAYQNSYQNQNNYGALTYSQPSPVINNYTPTQTVPYYNYYQNNLYQQHSTQFTNPQQNQNYNNNFGTVQSRQGVYSNGNNNDNYQPNVYNSNMNNLNQNSASNLNTGSINSNTLTVTEQSPISPTSQSQHFGNFVESDNGSYKSSEGIVSKVTSYFKQFFQASPDIWSQ